MANYAASVLAKGQAIVTQRNQAPEQRRKIPTVMELALKNQEYSIPNAPDLRKAPQRPVEINYFVKRSPGAATTKAAFHTGTYNDTAKVELTYVSHVETFSLPRKIADNNIITYQQMFNNLYEEAWKNIRTRHDTTALAFLFANRMQLPAATINPQIASAKPGVYNDTTFALEVDATKHNRFMQMAQIYMKALYFTGQYDIVADLQTNADFQFYLNQATGNSVNTNYQFQNANIAETQDNISADYDAGSMLIMPARSFAGMYWNEGLNKRGVNAGENEVGLLGTQADPIGSGAVADISRYTKRADTSANTTGGSTQDIVDQWEVTLTIAYALPPLSLAGDSVVHLVGQAS